MNEKRISPIRLALELRAAAENVLREGENLSSFVEQAVLAQIRRRKIQQEFLEAGLASLAKAEDSDTYFDADEVVAELDDMLASAGAMATRPLPKLSE